MTAPVIIIVGASMGGLRTAEALRRSGYAGGITVIGDEVHAPYNRPPLSKEVLAADVNHDAVAFPIADALSDVEWILGRRVQSVDLEKNLLLDDQGTQYHFDAVVIATGLRARRLGLPAQPSVGSHVIRSLDDAVALRAEIKEGTRVVVYGAGFVGCEVAATARKLGAHVTVVGKGALPLLRPLGAELATKIQSLHESNGVRFFMDSTITKVSGGDRVESVLLNSGVELYTQVLIEAIGSEPNLELLQGNDVDLDGGIGVDPNLRVLRPSTGGVWENAYVVGDVARFPIPAFAPRSRRVEHWNLPTEMGRQVGKVLAAQFSGDPDASAQALAAPFAPIPSFWSDQFDMSLLAYGLLDDADDIRLLEGEADGDCIYGYFSEGELMGVCGVGMRSKVMAYRNKVGRR